jgi:hypothetical protein
MYIPHDVFKRKIGLKIVAFLLVKKKPTSGIGVIKAGDGNAVSLQLIGRNQETALPSPDLG